MLLCRRDGEARPGGGGHEDVGQEETQGEITGLNKTEAVGLEMKEPTGEIVREKILQVALPESRRIHRVCLLRV